MVTGVPALTEADLAAVDTLLDSADAERLANYPGDRTDRQPVHTVYVPADRFHRELVAEWGAAAAAALAKHAPTAEDMAAALGFDPGHVRDVWPGVIAKLEREPIEDLRVDLEDGYGQRADEEEDRHALAAGHAIAAAVAANVAPPFIGVRFKSLEGGGIRRRGLRSLDLVLGAVLSAGPLPGGWVVTLPKVTSAAQVAAMVEICGRLERAYGLDEGTLRFEIQVETPQAILQPDGTAGVAAMVHASAGRCTGLHFGTYDYTAGLGIAGGYQAMDHPAADHAKAIMQLAAADTGVWVSDGSTNVLPVGGRDAVHAAWALHARLVRRSLERGFYQGWDLHPAQLPTRFIATYAFFHTGLAGIGARLDAYLHGADSGFPKAPWESGGPLTKLPQGTSRFLAAPQGGRAVLDEPATAQALAAFLLRGVHCGAVAEEEITKLTGATLDTISSLAARRVS
jgi:citrate lyase beta subunit